MSFQGTWYKATNQSGVPLAKLVSKSGQPATGTAHAETEGSGKS